MTTINNLSKPTLKNIAIFQVFSHFFFFFDTEEQTKDCAHARLALHHQSHSPALVYSDRIAPM
jgi:hypothetical protein